MKRSISQAVILTTLLFMVLWGLYASAPASAADNSDVEGFVTRFYELCLGRSPEPAGLDGWVAFLLNGTQTGSDVANGFVFSTEFLNTNTTNEKYLQVLYEAFFNRQPDPDGQQGWLDALASGSSRKDILNGFIYATEFAELCEEYGIKAFEGHITKAQREAVEAFVTRFYQLCLDRDPEAAGLEGWTNNLVNQIQTGADVANGFIFSQEFIDKNTTNDEYLTILYKAFFNRGPDQAGWDGWLSELNAGKNRGEILDGFIKSAEFSNLCCEYGINAFAGSVCPNPNNKLLSGEYVEAAAWGSGYGIYNIEYFGDGNAYYETIFDTNNSDGAGNFSYDINDNGTFSGQYNGKLWHGVVSRDGKIVVYVQNGTIEVGVRKSTNANNLKLNGRYEDASFSGGIYEVTYNGFGNGRYDQIYSLNSEDRSRDFTYDTDKDGTFTGKDDIDTVWRGVIEESGNSIIHVMAGDIGIDVQRSSNATNLSLKGEYVHAALWEDKHGTYLFDFDGTGNATYQSLYLSDGSNDSGSMSYSISPDGTLTGYKDGELCYGVVSPDGDLVVIIFDDPAMSIGVKSHLREEENDTIVNELFGSFLTKEVAESDTIGAEIKLIKYHLEEGTAIFWEESNDITNIKSLLYDDRNISGGYSKMAIAGYSVVLSYDELSNKSVLTNSPESLIENEKLRIELKNDDTEYKFSIPKDIIALWSEGHATMSINNSIVQPTVLEDDPLIMWNFDVAGISLYGIIGDRLVKINSDTGKAESHTTLLIDDLKGLTYVDSEDSFFSIAYPYSDPQLAMVNKNTGVVILMGNIHYPFFQVINRTEAIAYNPKDGQLYLAVNGLSSNRSSDIVTVDPITAEVTYKFSISGTLENEADAMVFADGALYIMDIGGPPTMYTVNLSTGNATLIGAPGGYTTGNIADMAYYDWDNFYGHHSGENMLLRLSKDSTEVSKRGQTHSSTEFDGKKLTGLAILPED